MYNTDLLHEMIHPVYDLFLAIYLAHLLTDFVFQTTRIVSHKHHGEWRGYLIHGVTHYLTVLVIVALADPRLLPTLSFQLLAVSLSLVHLLLDWTKFILTKSHRIPDNARTFVVDQAIHLVTVIGAVFIFVRPPLQAFVWWFHRIRFLEESILLVSVVYVLVIFGGGYFIRVLIGPLWKEEGQTKKEHDEVINAGLYIGWLERFLILTALFLQSPATAGFILAAKSIARYPELKSVRFAEYFLIGTLLSVAIAIGGATILLKALYGTVTLGK
jgi:hypothetical protein